MAINQLSSLAPTQISFDCLTGFRMVTSEATFDTSEGKHKHKHHNGIDTSNTMGFVKWARPFS